MIEDGNSGNVFRRLPEMRIDFDALDASWCSCLVTERTLVCPHCLQCFCKAPAAYKSRFWSNAPKALWDRKFKEHNEDFTPPANPIRTR